MLHIVNGEATLPGLYAAGIAGDLVVWGDLLMDGPAVNGLDSPDDWRLRAAWLEQHLAIPPQQYLQRMQESLSAIGTLDQHDRVVLWFEDDLFCQLHLVFILARLAHTLSAANASIVCSDERLGPLPPARLAERFEERTPLTPARTLLARQFWDAYTSPDPTPFAGLLTADTSAWPRLHDGILSHLRRFPAGDTGLNSIERVALGALDTGAASFANVFQAVSSEPLTAQLGLGDVQVWAMLRDLAGGSAPVVTLDGGVDDLAAVEVRITEAGRRTLAGQQDWAAVAGQERWLGGVHLAPGERLWRWDEARQQLL